jgi:hypothetical protein
MESVVSVLSTIGAVLLGAATVFSGVYKFVDLIEENASDELEKPISAWLRRQRPS